MGPKLILLLGLALLILIDCGQGVPEINEKSVIVRADTNALTVGRHMTTLRPHIIRKHNKKLCFCKVGKGSANAVCQCYLEKRICKMENHKNLKICKDFRHRNTISSPM